MTLWHWLEHCPLWWPETGPGYAFGSSWAGANLSFMGASYVLWRRHNCHEKWCLRISRHTLTDNDHHRVYCHKHVDKYKGEA